jgi:gliding motility-associated-like protein
MRKFLLLFIAFLYHFFAYTQDFSNKGKDFWVAYGYHQIMNSTGGPGGGGNGQQMVLYFATEEITTVTVTIPGIGWTRTYSNIPANTVYTSDAIPKGSPTTPGQDARLTAESLAPENKGIHIVADKSIVAYAHIYNQNVSGATILFPTPTLGKEYYSINFTNISNTQDANCWFYVVACDTGMTTVEITPSVATINHAAGVPFTVNLSQGQVYNTMATFNNNSFPQQGGDLTGSRIRSISSGSGGCKRIGVFSGSGRISITCNGSASSSDNYMVQAFPKSAWGKKYLTAPTGGMSNNFFRICVTDPATVVTINGVPIGVPLTNNFYYEIGPSPNPLRIESSLPILVAQYTTSQQECGNGGVGDPEVIYLSPVEQNISKVLWNATTNFNITSHYFNVVIPNTGTAISSFTLDGTSVPSTSFTVHPQDAGYSYLTRGVTAGQHIIQSDSGFNAIAYGFGDHESYGYNAGTNIRDLFNFIRPLNPYSLVPDAVACTGTPFYLTVTLPFQPTSLFWNFHGFQTDANIPVPVVDSTYLIGVKQVWRYKLPTPYTYIPTGIYPITIVAGTTTSEGCGNTFERDFDLHVYDPPSAKIDWLTHSGCLSDTVYFRDTSVYESGTFSYKWFWDFGDGTIDSVRYPKHKYLAPGTYNVKFAMLSNVGCFSDTGRRTITVNQLPTASISGNASVCQNSTPPVITFTGAQGTSPYTFTYSLNGGASTTITTTSGSAVTLPVPTTTVGTYTYALSHVTGATCAQNQSGSAVVTVLPLPTATIGGSITICQDAPSPNITFTGASGASAPYTFTYSLNGSLPQTVTTITGNSVTVPVPTGIAGTFNYTLISVREGSNSACLQNVTGSAIVTVNPLPTATIAGTTAVCLNGVAPLITFTGAGAVAPYTFTYSINGGAPLTISTTAGNSVTVAAPTGVAGSFTYSLISVKESSSLTCSQAQSGSAVITVYPLPLAAFGYSTPSCAIKTVSFSDMSLPNVGNLTEWNWTFDDPASGTLNSSVLQFPSHTFETARVYFVSLVVKTDRGCMSAPAVQPVIINPRPEAGFINPEVCLTDTYAQFVDTSKVTTGSVTGWSWNFGDPASGPLNTSTASNPQHSYNSLGIKNVELIVTTSDGCKDTLQQSFTVNGDIPVANFTVTNPAGLCANDSVSIINSSSVNVGSIGKIEIYWDNVNTPSVFQTDDNPFPGKVYRHLYPNLQTDQSYTIRYRAYSGSSCINDKLVTILVHAAPKVSFVAMPNTCYNVAPFQITQASEPNGVPEFSHIFSGPGTSPSGIFDPIAAGIGVHTIWYKFTSAAGCSDSISQTIRVLDTASAKFSHLSPVCDFTPATFQEESTAPAGVILASTTWDFGDGSPAETHLPGSTVLHSFPATGTYTVKLYNTSASGCNSFVRSIPVVVNPRPVPVFSLLRDTVCLPNAVVEFNNSSTITGGAALVYSWNFADPFNTNNTSTAVNPEHQYTSVGPFGVKLQAISLVGCAHDTTIMINPVHPQPIAAFGFDKPSVCIGDQVTLSDNSDPKDGSTISWNWDFGNGTTSTESQPTYTYPSPGTYNVTHYIVNSFGCNSDTLPKVFNVYAYPVVDAGPDRFVLEGGNALLEPIVSGNDLSFSWIPDLYLNNNEIRTPVTTPLRDIKYVLTVTGRGGCASRDSMYVKVLLAPLIPNTFTPNGDGINETWLIRYLDTYPNNRVQIFTRTGQLVFESRGYRVPWDGTVKGKPLPFDTYYYIIEPESGRKPITGYVTIVK